MDGDAHEQPVDGAADGARMPARLGRYESICELGRGGYGVVYQARDPALARPVAIKLLLASHAASAAVQVRLRREAQSLAQLDHPNVVRVFDIGVDEESAGRPFYIVMEYVDGGSLASWLAQPRPPERVIDLFVAAARGLAAAHRAGIMHRDFKPANVMLTAEGTPKVADFGLARPVDSLEPHPPTELPSVIDPRITSTNERLGTPYYMAPEQYRGASIDARADQYAWCLALVRELAGGDPYGVHGPRELMRAKLGGPPPAPDLIGVPHAVWKVLARGLAVEPADRFANMDELIAALSRARKRGRWGRHAIAVLAGIGGAVGFMQIGGAAHCERLIDASPWQQSDRELWRARGADGDPWTEHFIAQMDAHAQSFDAQVAGICGRGVEPQPWHDRAVDCLLAHRDEVGRVLAAAAELPAEHGPYYELGLSFTSPTACADPSLAMSRMLTRDTYTRRDELLAQALVRSGQLDQARALARQIVEAGGREETAWYVLASASLAAGDAAAAGELYEALYFRATAEHNLVDAAAAAAHLVGVSTSLGRDDQVEQWARHARSALERSGGDERVSGILDSHLGERAFWQGDYALALSHQQRALDSLVATYGADAEPSQAVRNNLALTLEQLGRFDEALEHHDQLYRARLRAHGIGHVDVYVSAQNLCNLLFQLGALDEAASYCERAVVAATESLGQDSVQAKFAALALVQIEARKGEDVTIPDAPAPGGHALEVELVRVAVDQVRAEVLRHAGRPTEARAAIEAAWTRAIELLGEGHPLTRDIAIERAAIVALAGDPTRGLFQLHALCERDDGELRHGLAELELGVVLLELGEPDLARAPLVDALESIDRSWPGSAHAQRAADALARAQLGAS